jgi:two-component system, chemotaxis family, CheB/CheR fusion protein
MVVGVGASSGGMEAFIKLLRAIPTDIPAAFVYISHLDPHAESSLDAIFQRETKLPVVTVHDEMPVKAGHIYVLPPNKRMKVVRGVLYAEVRQSVDGQHRPIDIFLQSLAQDQANYAVAVLLSGNGTDGVAGLQQIKMEGGITFAQNEASAPFPSLPANAFSGGSVDFVLPPAGIAQELNRIARHPAFLRPRAPIEPTDAEPQTELHRIFGLLRALHGVDFSHYKPSTLNRRILRRMVLRKFDNLAEYVAHLQQNPAEVDLLFNDLLINVTAFFRDPEVFQALRKKVFPKLIKKDPNEAVRVWIPGCATGEEVYSMAIELFEFLGKGAQSRMMQVFATDISEQALTKARSGTYSPEIVQNISSDRLRRYFQKLDNGDYQIAKFIRDTCVFARQNLIEDPPFSKLDLVSCRNVLIYLGPILQKKVMPIFHYSLKPGGYLLLGGSETIGTSAELFVLTDKKNKIYVKREVATRPEVEFLPRQSLSSLPDPVAQAPSPEADHLYGADFGRYVDRMLLSRFAPSGVVINTRMEVLQFRGQTGAYLEHPPGDATLNILKMLRQELLVDVRTLISRAGKLDAPARRDKIRFTAFGKRHVVNAEVIPFKAGSPIERFFLVLFTEVAEEEQKPAAGNKRSRSAGAGATGPEVLQMREELSATKESLQAIIEEQEATNEELKSANEEIQSSNEELQSTNEELETAKEELQSTNEELTTLNEELQTRNGELSLLNNDLGNLLASVSMPILMLGNDLRVRRFTPVAERFFNLIPTDVGRRITDINPNVNVPNLDRVVAEVIDSLKTQEHDVQDKEGRWYSLRVRPYRTTDNRIDGAVVVVVDIDEMKRAVTEFMTLVDVPLLTLRGDLRVETANEAFHAKFNTTEAQIRGTLIYELQDGAWEIPALKTLLEGSLPEKNHISRYRIDHDFGSVGRKIFNVNAHRLIHRGKGTQITLLAFTEVRQ